MTKQGQVGLNECCPVTLLSVTISQGLNVDGIKNLIRARGGMSDQLVYAVWQYISQRQHISSFKFWLLEEIGG